MRLFFQLGFSLIELMIVVAIIGILSIIAIPSYQNYTKQARFAEIVAAVQPFKTAVALALQEGVPLSELNTGMHGIPAPPKSTKNLANLYVKEGVITAIASSLIANVSYILKPNAEGTIWTMSGTCIKSGICHA